MEPRPTRVQVIWKALVRAQGYQDSPTMAGLAWDTAERIATAIRVAERHDKKRKFAMTTRERYTAEYHYPGALFPEEIYRDIPAPTLEAALAAAPTGDPADGWFGARDGWYAVAISKIEEKLFKADDGEETWVRQGSSRRVANYVFGEKIHIDDPRIAGDYYRTLRSNVENGSREPLRGWAVHTRAGNFQIASDYTDVIETPAPALA